MVAAAAGGALSDLQGNNTEIFFSFYCKCEENL